MKNDKESDNFYSRNNVIDKIHAAKKTGEKSFEMEI